MTDQKAKITSWGLDLPLKFVDNGDGSFSVSVTISDGGILGNRDDDQTNNPVDPDASIASILRGIMNQLIAANTKLQALIDKP